MIAKSVSLTSGIAMPQACLARVDVVRSTNAREAERADAVNGRMENLPRKQVTRALASIAPHGCFGPAAPRRILAQEVTHSPHGACVAPRGSGHTAADRTDDGQALACLDPPLRPVRLRVWGN